MKDIESLLWNIGERYEGNADLHMNPMTVKQAAAAIAELVSQEIEKQRQLVVDGHEALLSGYQKDKIRLEARLAELKEYAWHKKDCPVRTLVAAAWLPSQDVMKAARMRCNCGYFEALAAAGEGRVVAELDGRWGKEMIGNHAYYYLTLDGIQPYQDGKLDVVTVTRGNQSDEDGQRVRVVVIAEGEDAEEQMASD